MVVAAAGEPMKALGQSSCKMASPQYAKRAGPPGTSPATDPLAELIRTYYADLHVRDRMVEFLGGVSLQDATAYSITTYTSSQEDAPRLRRPHELFDCLDEGCDVERSLWDRQFLIADLDIEYVNFDFPGEPYLDPDRMFSLQAPVVETIKDLLVSKGVRPLHLLSGRGHHFVWKIRRDSACFLKLADLGRVPETLSRTYAAPQPPTGEVVDPLLGRAFAGLGMVIEYVGQQVLAIAGPRSEIPVQMMAVEVGTGKLGREIVSFDVSEYGDPLTSRHIRIPFSVYLKLQRIKEYVGEEIVAGMPPLFEIPLVEMQEAQAAQFMRRPELVAKLARHADTRIPDQTNGMERLVADYMQSPLATFHKWFYSQEPHAPDAWPSTYDRTSLDSLPGCVQTILQDPNDLLLKPAAVQHLVRVFSALGWHPRHIAGLIWSVFERDHQWGQQWLQMDPCWRAEFYTRVFAGLIFTSTDSLTDFNCVSHQEKGYCPYPGCPDNLEHYQRSLSARRNHE